MAAGKIGEGTRRMRGLPTFATEPQYQRQPSPETEESWPPTSPTRQARQKEGQGALNTHWTEALQSQQPSLFSGRSVKVGILSPGIRSVAAPMPPPVKPPAAPGSAIGLGPETNQGTMPTMPTGMMSTPAGRKFPASGTGKNPPFGKKTMRAPGAAGFSGPVAVRWSTGAKPTVPGPQPTDEAQPAPQPVKPVKRQSNLTPEQKALWKRLQRDRYPVEIQAKMLRHVGVPEDEITFLTGMRTEESVAAETPVASLVAPPEPNVAAEGLRNRVLELLRR